MPKKILVVKTLDLLKLEIPLNRIIDDSDDDDNSDSDMMELREVMNCERDDLEHEKQEIKRTKEILRKIITAFQKKLAKVNI